MNADIIHDGGWRAVTMRGRRRARFFGFMSVVWLLVSAPVLLFGWQGGMEVVGGWSWLVLGLACLHPVWLGLAIWYGLTERPRTYTENMIEEDEIDQGI